MFIYLFKDLDILAKELSRMGRQCSSSSKQQRHRNNSSQKNFVKSNLSPPPPAPPPRDASISNIDTNSQLSASISSESVEPLGEPLLASDPPKVINLFN